MSASGRTWRQQRDDRELARRQRWADQENDKRRHDHDRAVAAWRQRRDTAEALLAGVEGSRRRPRLQPGLRLRPGETLLFESDNVLMVDRQDGPRLGGLGDVAFSITESPLRPATPDRVADSGVVAVTDRRIVFQGGRKREWDYAKLRGFTLLPDGRNLFMVANRKYVSGLLVPPEAVTAFRFHVIIAIAGMSGRRDQWMNRFAEQLSAFIAAQPVPRPQVTPADAPPAPVLDGWRLPSLVTAVTVVVVLLCMGLFNTAGDDDRTDRTADATGSTATATSDRPTPTTSTPSKPDLSDALSSAEPEPEPEPEPESQPAVDLCGAPSNPYGYNYCGNGGMVYDPPSDICVYFSCIDSFSNGKGYMIECSDGQVSMSGGRPGSCSHHGGNGRTVFSG